MKAIRKEQQRTTAFGLANAIVPAVAQMVQATYTTIDRSTETMCRTVALLEKHSVHLGEALERSLMREKVLLEGIMGMQSTLMDMHGKMMGMRELVSESREIQFQQAREFERNRPCNEDCDKRCDKFRTPKVKTKK